MECNGMIKWVKKLIKNVAMRSTSSVSCHKVSVGKLLAQLT